MKNHEFYMKEALNLALGGLGMVSPNPLVGAVLVKNDRIIGRGYHRRYGEDHAEIMAIKDAKDKGFSPANSILYTTLEPCCHELKQTPPCTKAIIKNNISTVVIARRDGNPFVNGSGIEELQSANISVIEDVLKRQEEDLNCIYHTFVKTKRPYIHLKWAQTLDGKMAAPNGDSRWISDKKARQLAHEWRFTHDGVLVGRKTLNQDNPHLNIRLVDSHGKLPWRIVMGQIKNINLDSRVLTDEFSFRTVILTSNKDWQEISPSIRDQLIQRKICVIARETLKEKLKALGEMKITSILIEGGSETLAHFIKENLFDRLSVVITPSLLGSGINGPSLNSKNMNDIMTLQGSFTPIGGQILFDSKG